MSDSSQPTGLSHAALATRALMPPDATPLECFLATSSRLPGQTFLHYFDTTLSYSEIDVLSDAVARGLRAYGVTSGDRVALFLQNDPDFAIAQLATWKLGAVCVSINPMLRGHELKHILVDSGATALVVLEDLWNDVARDVVPTTSVGTVLLTDPVDWAQTQGGAPRPELHGTVGDAQVVPLRSLIGAHSGEPVEHAGAGLDDVALICYTSGTTGHPKGVVATHRNVAYGAAVYQAWLSIDEKDVFLGGAPIFHVTGLIAGLALAYRTGMSIALFHRFDPAVCLEQIEKHQTTFTIMATTAFQSLVHHQDASTRNLRSLTKVYSGGAPVTGAIDQQWRALTGRGIHNVYGLTETTGATHAVPPNAVTPLDVESGILSVGLPMPGVEARLVDQASGLDVSDGEQGELWIKGPMVMREYWGLPKPTAEAFVDGYFRTGDVGKRDADGWFYVIDRMKDMINASGYKVWPREVEELLLQNSEIREAAVVGIPDSYRGETVKAYVVLNGDSQLTPDEIVAFGKSQMAAYKYPRQVEIVDELPKTASGKVIRQDLREKVSMIDVSSDR